MKVPASDQSRKLVALGISIFIHALVLIPLIIEIGGDDLALKSNAEIGMPELQKIVPIEIEYIPPKFQTVRRSSNRLRSVVTSEDKPDPNKKRISMLVGSRSLIEARSKAGKIEVSYPSVSRRREEEGSVALLAHITDKGYVSSVRVSKSSGFTRLDEAAVVAVKAAEFIPARQFGKNVSSKKTVRIHFKLK